MREIKNVNRQVASHNLESRYFERMAQSMGDKARILDYLPEVVAGEPAPRVLDVGAGGGEFANALAELGYDVTALDANEDAVNRIRSRFPKVTTVQLLANQATQLGAGMFDAVICSSILHEVFSYGDNVRGPGHVSSISRAFDAFHYVLKPGGVLVIRDGVLPENWEDHGSITLLDGHEPASVFTYLDMCPFANGVAHGDMGNAVNLTWDGKKTFKGNVRSLLEFAYTYTWGLDSYPRETQELYALKTLDEYADFLTVHGFDVELKESYLQPGYSTHLQTMMLLDVNGESNSWFDSNALWVARKK